MAYPSSSAIDKNYVSSIYFLDKREILDKVLDVTNEEVSFLDVMEAYQRRIPTTSAEIHHFVNVPLYKQVTVPAGTSLAALGVRNGDVVVLNNANSVANHVVGDIWYIRDVTDVKTAANVTLLGNNIATKGTATVLATGQVLTVVSNAFGEGSNGPSPVRFGLKKYMSRVQIFKMGYELTDIEMANKIEVTVGGQPYYMMKAQNDAFNKYKIDISAGLLWNPAVASSFSGFNNDLQSPPTATQVQTPILDKDDKAIQFTRGLHDWAKGVGFDQTGVSGSTVLEKLAVISKLMSTLRCPDMYDLILGASAGISFDDSVKTLNVTNAGVANHGQRVSVDGPNVNLNVESLTLYNRTWRKVPMPMIDHEIGKAFLGTDHSKYVYFVPQNKIKIAGESEAIDRMRVRYLEGPNMSFGYREIRLGGLAPTPTDNRSVFECNYESIQGLQIAGAEHFGISKF